MVLSRVPSQGGRAGWMEQGSHCFPCSRPAQCHSQLGLGALCGPQCLEVAGRCLPRDSLLDLKVVINWWGPGCLARAHLLQGTPTYLMWAWEDLWAFN